jgi:hypothetical protein
VASFFTGILIEGGMFPTAFGTPLTATRWGGALLAVSAMVGMGIDDKRRRT